MTGHGDIPMSVRAMKAGATDFLTKPFRDQDMLDAVAAAIDKDMAQRRDAAAAKEVAALAATLTPRETGGHGGGGEGLMNKQIAGLLGISEIPGQAAPRQRHAEDGRPVGRRPGAEGRAAGAVKLWTGRTAASS